MRLRGKDFNYKEIVEPLFDSGGYEIPRTVKVKSPFLSKVRSCGNIVCVILMLLYVMLVDKGYLKHARIQGYSRVTLQHPVHNCNPLHAKCKSNMKPLKDLPYCSEKMMHTGSEGKNNKKQVKCRYMDTFEVNNLNTGLELGNILVPTRISTFTQKRNGDCKETTEPCQYDTSSETHDFVADIEDYTLLIDHGFSCPELKKKGASWSTVGFYIPDMIGKTDWSWPMSMFHSHSRPILVPCRDPDSKSCAYSKKYSEKHDLGEPAFQITGSAPLLERVEKNYDAAGVGDIQSTRFGDIVKISSLLKIVDIDLDTDNFGAHHLRTEGEVIIIEIDYTNYNYFHFPNNLEPIYEYKMYRAPADSFKTTRVLDEGGGSRKIIDVHGIEIITRVVGSLGMFSMKNLALSIVELSIILGFVNWMLHCVALNLNPGRGEALEGLICEEIAIEGVALEAPPVPFSSLQRTPSTGVE